MNIDNLHRSRTYCDDWARDHLGTKPMRCTFLDGTVVTVTPSYSWSLKELIARESGYHRNSLLLLDPVTGEEFGSVYKKTEVTVMVRSCPVEHRKYCIMVESKANRSYPSLTFGLTLTKDDSWDVEANWAMRDPGSSVPLEQRGSTSIDITVERVPDVAPPRHLITFSQDNGTHDFKELTVVYTPSLHRWGCPKQMMTATGVAKAVTYFDVVDQGLDERYERPETQEVVHA
jgi:hypothetical protein